MFRRCPHQCAACKQRRKLQKFSPRNLKLYGLFSQVNGAEEPACSGLLSIRKERSILQRCVLPDHGEDVQIVANYFWQGPVVSELVRLMASRSSRALTVSFNMNNGEPPLDRAAVQGKK